MVIDLHTTALMHFLKTQLKIIEKTLKKPHVQWPNLLRRLV